MNYYKEHQAECNKKTNDFTLILPRYATNFLASKNRIEESTRLEYARDIKAFLDFVLADTGCDEIKDIPVSALGSLTPEYLTSYFASIGTEETSEISNSLVSRATKMRKLSSLNSFYAYLFKAGLIPSNPMANVEKFASKKKDIISLDQDEVWEFLEAVDKGPDIATQRRQALYHQKTRIRDLMLACLLLGTGIRVSECVGLDTTDVSLKHNLIHITRKGNKGDVVYMSDDLTSQMAEYLEWRKSKVSPDEKALFCSYQGTRLSVKSVENMIKKYNQLAQTMKHITPHKLRSTYGRAVYQETGDIYLVATLLGHDSVETTKKYYVQNPDKDRVRNMPLYGENKKPRD